MESKKTFNFVFFIVLCFVLFFRCENRSFSKQAELVAHINNSDNGYFQSKAVNGVIYTFLYKPTDLMVSQELSNNNIKNVNVDSIRKEYKKYLYFNISMSKNNKELLSVGPKNKNEFGSMVNRLAFGMSDKVHLFTNKKDTIDMIDYVYPRLYGMTNATSMMFIYPRNETVLSQKVLNITIQDLGFNTGEVRFEIDVNRINNEPKLSFKN